MVLYESLPACMNDGEVLEGDLQDEVRRTRNREFRIQEYDILIFISDLFQRNLTVTAVCRLPSSFQDDDD